MPPRSTRPSCVSTRGSGQRGRGMSLATTTDDGKTAHTTTTPNRNYLRPLDVNPAAHKGRYVLPVGLSMYGQGMGNAS
jgi:hypothetical protein